MDTYQKRYEEHQKKKKGQLMGLMQKRYSERIFSDKEISSEYITKILDAGRLAPSSCDRGGVRPVVLDGRDDKQLLSGLLVGGVGWVHRAPHLILLVANKTAYKENLEFMPYLDAGFMAQNIWLECTDLGIGCCFVNPNIREEHKYILHKSILTEGRKLCGVLAIGYKDD